MGLPAFQTEPTEYVSPEDYLRLERQSEVKHEYIKGKSAPWPGLGTPTTLFVRT